MKISTARETLERITACYQAAGSALSIPELCARSLVPALGDESHLLPADSLRGRLHHFLATPCERRRAAARVEDSVGRAFILLARQQDDSLDALPPGLRASLLQHYAQHPDWALSTANETGETQPCETEPFCQKLRSERLGKAPSKPEENPLHAIEPQVGPLSLDGAAALVLNASRTLAGPQRDAENWLARYAHAQLSQDLQEDAAHRHRLLGQGRRWQATFEAELFPPTPLQAGEQEKRLEQHAESLHSQLRCGHRFLLPMRIDGGRRAWREILERVRRLPPDLLARLPAQVKPFVSGKIALDPEAMVEAVVHDSLDALRKLICQGQADGQLPTAEADILGFLELIERKANAIPIGAQRFLECLPESVRANVAKLWRLCSGPHEEWIKLAAKLTRMLTHVLPVPSILSSSVSQALNAGRIVAKTSKLARRIDLHSRAIAPFIAYHHAADGESPQWKDLEQRLIRSIEHAGGPQAELAADRLDELTETLSDYIAPEFFDMAGLSGLVEGGELLLDFQPQEDGRLELSIYAPSNHQRWHEAGWPLHIRDIDPARITPQLCRRLLDLAYGERLGSTQGICASAFYEGILGLLGGTVQQSKTNDIPALQPKDRTGLELAYQLKDPASVHEQVLRMRLTALLDSVAACMNGAELSSLSIAELKQVQRMLRHCERELRAQDQATLERLSSFSQPLDALKQQLESIDLEDKRDLLEKILGDLPIDSELLESIREQLSWFVGGRYDDAFDAIGEVIAKGDKAPVHKAWWERVAEEVSLSLLVTVAASIFTYAVGNRGALAKAFLSLSLYQSGKVFLPNSAYAWCRRVEAAMQRELTRHTLLFLWWLLQGGRIEKRMALSLGPYLKGADYANALLSRKQQIDLNLEPSLIERHPNQVSTLAVKDGAVRLEMFGKQLPPKETDLLTWDAIKRSRLPGPWPNSDGLEGFFAEETISSDLLGLERLAKALEASLATSRADSPQTLQIAMALVEQLSIPVHLDDDTWRMRNAGQARAALRSLVRISCALYRLYQDCNAKHDGCLRNSIQDRYLLCQYSQAAIAWQLSRQDEAAQLRDYQLQPQELRVLYWSRLRSARSFVDGLNGHSQDFHRRLEWLCRFFEIDLEQAPTAESLRQGSRGKLFSYLHVAGPFDECPRNRSLLSDYVEAGYIARLLKSEAARKRIAEIPGLRLMPADKQFLCVLWEEPFQFRQDRPIVPESYSLMKLQMALLDEKSWTGRAPSTTRIPSTRPRQEALYEETERSTWSADGIGILVYEKTRSEKEEREGLLWAEGRASAVQTPSLDRQWRNGAARLGIQDLADPDQCETRIQQLAAMGPVERLSSLSLFSSGLDLKIKIVYACSESTRLLALLHLTRYACLAYESACSARKLDAVRKHYPTIRGNVEDLIKALAKPEKWAEAASFIHPDCELDSLASADLAAQLLLLTKQLSLTGQESAEQRALLEKVLHARGHVVLRQEPRPGQEMSWLGSAFHAVAWQLGFQQGRPAFHSFYPQAASALHWQSLPQLVRDALQAPQLPDGLEAMRKRELSCLELYVKPHVIFHGDAEQHKHREYGGFLANLGRKVAVVADSLYSLLSTRTTPTPRLTTGLAPIYRVGFEDDKYALQVNHLVAYPVSKTTRFTECTQAELAAEKQDAAAKLFSQAFPGMKQQDFRNVYAEESEALVEAFALIDSQGHKLHLDSLMRALSDPVRLEAQLKSQPQFAQAMATILGRLWEQKRGLWASEHKSWRDSLLVIQACMRARELCGQHAAQYRDAFPDPELCWQSLDSSVASRSLPRALAYLAVRCLQLRGKKTLDADDCAVLLTLRVLFGSYPSGVDSLASLEEAYAVSYELLIRHRTAILQQLRTEGALLARQTAQFLSLPLDARQASYQGTSVWEFVVGGHHIDYWSGLIRKSRANAYALRRQEQELRALLRSVYPEKATASFSFTQDTTSKRTWTSADADMIAVAYQAELQQHPDASEFERHAEAKMRGLLDGSCGELSKNTEWTLLVNRDGKQWRLLSDGSWIEHGSHGERELRQRLEEASDKRVFSSGTGHISEVRTVDARRAGTAGTAADHPGLALLSRIADLQSLELETDSEDKLSRVRGGHLDLYVHPHKGQARLFVGDLAPGFMVAQEQAHPALQGIPSYLLLDDGSGQHKVLLSRGQALAASSWRLGKKLGRFAPLLAEALKTYGRNDSDPYCLFTIEDDGQLSSRAPQDLADLMYLYLARGEEGRAELVAYKLLEVLHTENFTRSTLAAVERDLLVLSSIPLPHLPLTRMRLKLRVALERARQSLDPEAEESSKPDPRALLLIGPCSSMLADLVTLSEQQQLEQLFDSEQDEWLAYSILSRQMRQLLDTQLRSERGIKSYSDSLIDQIGWNRLFSSLLQEPLKSRYVELQDKHGGLEGGLMRYAFDFSKSFFGRGGARRQPGMLDKIVRFVSDPVDAVWGSIFSEDDFLALTQQGSLGFASAVAPCLALKPETVQLDLLLESIPPLDDEYCPARQFPGHEFPSQDFRDKQVLTAQSLKQGFYTLYCIAYGECTDPALIKQLREQLALNLGGWDSQSRYLIFLLQTVLDAPYKAAYPHPERVFEKGKLLRLDRRVSQEAQAELASRADVELARWQAPEDRKTLQARVLKLTALLNEAKLKPALARELRRRIWLCIQQAARSSQDEELVDTPQLALAARLAYPLADRYLRTDEAQSQAEIEALLIRVTRSLCCESKQDYSIEAHEGFISQLSRSKTMQVFGISLDPASDSQVPSPGKKGHEKPSPKEKIAQDKTPKEKSQEQPQEDWDTLCAELHRALFLGQLSKQARAGAQSFALPVIKQVTKGVLTSVVQTRLMGLAGSALASLYRASPLVSSAVSEETLRTGVQIAAHPITTKQARKGVRKISSLFSQAQEIVEQPPVPSQWRAACDAGNRDIDAMYQTLTQLLFKPHGKRAQAPGFEPYAVPGANEDPLIAQRQDLINRSGRSHAEQAASASRQLYTYRGADALLNFAALTRHKHAQACAEIQQSKAAILDALNADRQHYLGLVELKRRFTESDLDCFFMTGMLAQTAQELQLPPELMRDLETTWAEISVRQTRLQDQLGRVLALTETALERYQQGKLSAADSVLEDLLEQLQARRTWQAQSMDAALARRYLIFEKRWGFLLWSKQSSRFRDWLKDINKSVLSELIMGLGKSDAGIPIGEAFAADGEHLVAVCWPSELAATAIENCAGNAWDIFRQEVHRLIFTRQKKVDASSYRALRQLHEHILTGRGAIHATRWDYSALELMFIQMHYEGAQGKHKDPQLKAAWKELQAILRLYRTRGVLFVDEIHEVDLYKRQQCWPLGDADCLPKDYYRPLEQIVCCMLEQPEFAHYLAINKMKAMPQEDFLRERSIVLGKLREQFLIAADQLQAFKDYVTGKLDAKPEFFRGHHSEEAIDIARGVFATLLPQCMDKAVNVNFGWSENVEADEEYAKPYLGNETPNPSSVTKDPYRCLVESFLMMGWSGVKRFQYQRVCSRLLIAAKKEALDTQRPLEKTYAASLYTKVTGLAAGDSDYMKSYEARKRHAQTIRMTGRTMYHQVKYWKDSLRSNAQNFHAMFATTKSCTGTPYNEESCADAQLQLDPGTLGKAISTIDSHSPEGSVAVLEAEQASEVLEEVLETYFHPDFSAQMLVDGGAQLRGVANHKVAERLWRYAKQHRPEIKAISFFNKAGRMMSYEGPNNILPRSQSSVSDKAARLTYLDQNHGFGANEPMERKAKVLILVSPSDPTHRKVQEGFRARAIKKVAQLFESDGASQQLYFATTRMGHRVMTGSKAAKEQKPAPIPLRSMWEHTIKEEAKLVEPANVQSFQDKLYNVARRKVMDKLLDAGSLDAGIALYRSAEKLLVSKQTVDPTKLFGARRIQAQRAKFVTAKRAAALRLAKQQRIFSRTELAEIDADLKKVHVPTLPNELPLWVDASGQSLDQAFDVGGELSVEASSLQVNQQQEMAQEHEAEQTLENEHELGRERQAFEEWPWDKRTDYRKPDWLLAQFDSVRRSTSCPLLRVQDLAQNACSEVKLIAEYLDQRLWLSNNFLPTRLRNAGEKQRKLGSKQQRPLESVLVYAKEGKDGQLTIESMGALAATDIKFLRQSIAPASDIKEEASQTRVFLYHVSCASVIAGDSVSNDELLVHPDFQALLAQLKLLDGQNNFGSSLDSLVQWMKPSAPDPQRHEHIAAAVAKIGTLRKKPRGNASDFDSAMRRCQEH